MLRTRLSYTIAILCSFVVFLGVMLYWGANEVSIYLYRSQMAYQAVDKYEELSQEAYRYFKQRMDLLLVEGKDSARDVTQSHDRLTKAIEELRKIFTETTHPAPTDLSQPQHPPELDRIARFTTFLEASMYRFDEVEQLMQQGNRAKAKALLSRFSEDEIDHKFQPLMDAAINDERAKALKAKEKLVTLVDQLRWIAVLASLLAAAFSILAATALLRRIKKPIEALMLGTNEISLGNLAYRIPIFAKDEFAYLAKHFNKMAERVELQNEKLQEAQVVLEHKVTERTRELSQLNSQLQRLNQARQEFFADISHELRTPLTIIRGEAEVTLRGEDREAEEYKDALHRILDLSQQLGKLVNDLFFLAHADSANLQFDWEMVDLSELLVSTVEDIQVIAREKSIAVTLTKPDHAILVRGDKQRLRQVLFILSDNACRYSNDGGRIEFQLDQDVTGVVLQISDCGIGIPAQDLEMIFDRYFRSSNARHSGEQGMGLGLPMAKSIVKAHGGEISVNSTEGIGTTFTVRLPFLPLAAEIAQ